MVWLQSCALSGGQKGISRSVCVHKYDRRGPHEGRLAISNNFADNEPASDLRLQTITDLYVYIDLI